ncbi:MAG: sigma-54 interaction domain-containing protein [Clostridium sp.]|uniref:sigma-54 interaction domain-containing protein n=1 Tax=Clostridium sp. TaxID=1506 RepID=UPI003D6D1716
MGTINSYYYNQVINSINEGVIVIDKEGTIKIINNAAEKMLKVNAESSLGKYILNIFPYGELLSVMNNCQTQFNKKEGKFVVTRKPIIQNGEVIGGIQIFSEKMGSNFITNSQNDVFENNSGKDKKVIYTFKNILGASDKSRKVMDFAKRVAKIESNVLITGESGTGKELFAHSIHNASRRCLKPFVKINCGAIPAELFESEMFGYEEGAFTGAKRSGKIGKFEHANGGTILLDEIGDMPMNMQVKLLRIIQEKELVRVGGNDAIKVDIRVIASTNKSLEKLINDGKFREDLYYRLDVMHLKVPALRERIEDIEELSNGLRIKICKKNGIYSEGISRDAIDYLKSYSWPGNIRQLENVLERAINLLDEELFIMPKHLPEKITKNVIKKYSLENNYLKDVVENVEKDLIMECIEKTGGNKKETAKILGLSRAGLYKKLNRYNLMKSTGTQ